LFGVLILASIQGLNEDAMTADTTAGLICTRGGRDCQVILQRTLITKIIWCKINGVASWSDSCFLQDELMPTHKGKGMFLKKLLGCLAVLSVSSICHAGLMGSEVTANYHFTEFGDIIGTGTATVTGAYEFTDPTGFPGDWNAFDFIDIGEDYILFDFRSDACCEWNGTAYNGFEFIFDPGVLADLSDATFSPNANAYVGSMISFAGDTLYINWGGGDILGVDSVQVDLAFATVPVPASVFLLGLGLAGLGLARRRV